MIEAMRRMRKNLKETTVLPAFFVYSNCKIQEEKKRKPPKIPNNSMKNSPLAFKPHFEGIGLGE